uniref:SEC14 like lipid binding 6 n=1 Tax=Spermophilus dauricus TaxID=99837 RepID=A0A8C9PN54_SPEDA
MSGQVGDLSPSQEKSLAQFRVNVQDVLSALSNADDSFLLRWLRARSFDLQKSEDMLRKHMEFRKQQDLDNILAWQPPEHPCTFPYSGPTSRICLPKLLDSCAPSSTQDGMRSQRSTQGHKTHG